MKLRASVPCAGCTACCRDGETLILHPEMGDRPETYVTYDVVNPLTGRPAKALQHKPGTGECIYLGPTGCTIHDRSPALCREFDCRNFFTLLKRHERRQLVRAGMVSGEVMDAARTRLPKEVASA